LLSAIRLRRLGREPVRSELMAQGREVKEPYPVDFTASPVELADAAKGFNVSNQGSLRLIFGGFDQHGPIVARDPIPAS